jgi:hypothetical protein
LALCYFCLFSQRIANATLLHANYCFFTLQCRICNHLSVDFMFQLGLSPATGRGPHGEARRLREQRLFRASISFDRATRQGVR